MIISRCTFLKNNNNFSLVLRSLLVKINYYEIFMLAQTDNSMKSGVKNHSPNSEIIVKFQDESKGRATMFGKISRLGTLAILSPPLIEEIVKERRPNSGDERLKAASFRYS